MRVIAGRLRGRRLHGGRGHTVRPTSERARAGLFDWLGPIIEEARILDLFAGTGAIGIEALSRGAHEVVFVEHARPARAGLRRNVTELGLEASVEVLGEDVRRALGRLARAGRRFDLVFADPPYGEGWPERLLGCATLAELLTAGGFLVIESDAPEAPASAGTRLVYRDGRRYGGTRFDRYQTQSGSEGACAP